MLLHGCGGCGRGHEGRGRQGGTLRGSAVRGSHSGQRQHRGDAEACEYPRECPDQARRGDFVYDETEIEAMIGSVRMCRELGVNGVVVGALRKDGSIDTEAVRRLMAEAGGLHVTFHRAFDECADPFKALEDIIALGCDRLLTAGHASNVNDGEPTLKELNEKAAGRITILAGSGVRPGNIARLEASTGCKEFHSSSHGPDGRTSREVVAAMVNYNQ